MKKWMFLFVSLFTMQVAMADNDKPITFEQLPATAQTFIKQNFPNAKVAFVKMEKEFLDASYDVVFINGDKVEFDKKGSWKDITCRQMTVPQAAVPVKIQEFVKSNYPDAKVIKIEKDRYEYEVKLSNFWELTFDTSFNLIDMDNDND
ncbi:PepSY-like domain-containing protein [Bacteroides gallinaceum]|uniref:PepSY-like domain-containing protein n=1 Tax=Bacteroides gallinaceum TaxID=1462571 RepID=UPI0025A3DA08|nr:PepSY-like domain-containing protein [Bacteroides gallinaceum]MDM8155687.1 PepSY-like domain-containing protein [Bacteroides gallinaceum]